MSDSKIRINLREGTFEVEGSESFVAKCWEEFKEHLSSLPVMVSPEPSTQITVPESNAKIKKKNSSSTQKKTFELIPIDVNGNENTPSLKKFYEEKSPTSNQEIVTVFAYYLNKYLDIKNMKPGHVLFCYSVIKKPKPLAVLQLFSDTKSRHAWLDIIEPSTASITVAGENFVEHELPRTNS